MVRRLISSRNFFRRGERALPSVETDKVDHLVIDGHDLPGWTTGTTLLKTVTEPLTIVEPPKVIGAVIRDDAPTLPRRLDRWE